MKILVSIDDTDNIESRGTGEIARASLAEGITGTAGGSAGR